MSHKTYRICLLMVAIAATVGGILYYCLCVKDDSLEEKGTLVKQMQQTGERMKEAGKNVKDDVVQAFSRTGHECKEAAKQVGQNWKETANQVGSEVKNTASDVKGTFKQSSSDMVQNESEGEA